MEMVILTKIFFIVLIVSICNVVYEIGRFISAYADIRKTYTSSVTRRIFLWLSIAYIASIIFYGI
jgi:hypothetical protein